MLPIYGVSMFRFLGAFVLLTAILHSPAHAYIDPATGGAIASAVVGAFVALGVWFKTRWYKLKALFRRRDSDN